MSLSEQLNAVSAQLASLPPSDEVKTIHKSLNDFVNSFDPSTAVQVGEKLPAFTLKNAVGTEVSSSELLAKSSLLITFYRGEWCPFCNLALRALQKRLDDFEARGVTLVAISRELPDQALSTKEKMELKFHILSDIDNKYARELGIVWEQPEAMRAVIDKFGYDFKARNGSDDLALPIPATLLVNQQGIVRNRFLDPDYTKRLEPDEALEWVDAMNGNKK